MENYNDNLQVRHWGISRRQFIGAAGAIAGMTALLTTPLGSWLAAIFIRPDPLVALRAADFAKLVKQSFHFQSDGQPTLMMQLVQVQTLAPAVAGGECYSLLFRSFDTRALTQNTYRVAHDQLGIFSLFVVPAHGSESATEYVAVINRLPA